MLAVIRPRLGHIIVLSIAALAAALLGPVRALAQVTPFMQAVAEAAARDADIAAFYKANGYEPIWTGTEAADRARRAALLKVLTSAGDHALPVDSYNMDFLAANMRRITSQRDLGTIEVELSRTFLKYARDVQTGVLTPKKVDSGIVRDVPLRNRTQLLDAFSKSSPTAFLRALPPKAPEYTRLMKAKIELEKQLGEGGWGPRVPANSLKPGQGGDAVVTLRNRMIAMGYMRRSASSTYDADLQQAVQLFQYDNGLDTDGVAGPGTMAEINRQIEERLPNIIVAMERERWMNIPRGKRHVWVNLTDFTAAIIDDDQVTFKTRSVIGKNISDQRSPEFSDVMEYMEINPNWNVPRSIAVNEYLPRMLANPGAAGHLQLIDSRGRVISRGSVNWGAYNTRNFPYDLRQPPSQPQCAGSGKVHVPEPVQHLPARHPVQIAVPARGAGLQPWLHPAERPVRFRLYAAGQADVRSGWRVPGHSENRQEHPAEPGRADSGASGLSHGVHFGQGPAEFPPRRLWPRRQDIRRADQCRGGAARGSQLNLSSPGRRAQRAPPGGRRRHDQLYSFADR